MENSRWSTSAPPASRVLYFLSRKQNEHCSFIQWRFQKVRRRENRRRQSEEVGSGQRQQKHTVNYVAEDLRELSEGLENSLRRCESQKKNRFDFPLRCKNIQHLTSWHHPPLTETIFNLFTDDRRRLTSTPTNTTLIYSNATRRIRDVLWSQTFPLNNAHGGGAPSLTSDRFF